MSDGESSRGASSRESLEERGYSTQSSWIGSSVNECFCCFFPAFSRYRESNETRVGKSCAVDEGRHGTVSVNVYDQSQPDRPGRPAKFNICKALPSLQDPSRQNSPRGSPDGSPGALAGQNPPFYLGNGSCSGRGGVLPRRSRVNRICHGAGHWSGQASAGAPLPSSSRATVESLSAVSSLRQRDSRPACPSRTGRRSQAAGTRSAGPFPLRRRLDFGRLLAPPASTSPSCP